MANVDFAGQYKRIMRFFWDPEPKNDDLSPAPIWCLGIEYPSHNDKTKEVVESKQVEVVQTNTEENDIDQETVVVANRNASISHLNETDRGREVMIVPSHVSPDEENGWPPSFLDDFEARFWFTYRSHFAPIRNSTEQNAHASLSLAVRLRSQLVEQSGFTSDTGWGCMIRSGQCLIGNALQILRFGRGWRRIDRSVEEKQLLLLFADDQRAPFSLHNFVAHGAAACGKHPGEWFGPSATARCIQALSEAYPACGLSVYVNGDGPDVYEDAVLRLAKQADDSFRPVLILVGVRLGIERVNPVYGEALKKTLQLPQSIGIAGGRPSASHYFVGVQGDGFFFLDPHQTRPMLAYHEDASTLTEEELNSCHTRRLRRLHIDSMDPSMLIGFLIRDEHDWHQWRKAVSGAEGKPIVHVSDSELALHGTRVERSSALDEVEAFDDEC